MIKRINTLKRTGRFIMLNCAPGNEGDFTQLNTVFGANASGKSTLCDVMRSMTTGEAAYIMGRKRLNAAEDPEIVVALATENPPQTVRFQNGMWENHDACPQIHVYDERFVAENVLVGHHVNVDQRRNLYGLVIGSQAIALKQAVDLAEQNLTNATAEASTARSSLTPMLPDGYTIDSFRNIPEIENVDQQIAAVTEELATATKTNVKADSIRQRAPLAPAVVAEIPTDLTQVLASTLDDVALSAEQQIRQHLTATSVGLTTEWLGQGFRAQTGTDCPHCGQNMKGLEILQAYTAFFSGELQVQENARNRAIDLVRVGFGEIAQNQLRETLTAHETEQTWWEDAIGYRFELPMLTDRARVIDAQQRAHQAVVHALARKKATPGNAVELAADEGQAITNWESIAAELSAYNEQLVEINETLAQRKQEAGAVDLALLKQNLASLQACRRRYQQDVIDAYTAFDAAVPTQTAAQGAKQSANDALRAQSNQLMAEYGARINELLELFAVEFRIVGGANNDNYVTFGGGQPSGQLAIKILGTRISSSSADAANPARPSLANTLSGGDRSALALAFFLAKVEQDPELANSVVVFDDPFHSQDRSRQSRTIERIHGIARDAKQCFVLSHDLEFARAVAAAHGVASRTFYLDPLVDQTTLQVKELPMLPSRAYEKKYTLLNQFISEPAELADQLNNIAVILRTILEEYLHLKFPQRWIEGQDWLGTMIAQIRESTDDDPLINCRDLVDDLTQVNEYSQRFHHRTTGVTADVPNALELVSYARQTLSIIHK